MEIKGIIWVGIATSRREPLAAFFSSALGLEVQTDVTGFTRMLAANGDRVEIFGPEMDEYRHLDTGPVAGFWVDDAPTARSELLEAGVAECTAIETGDDGHRWFYFRAPDGNFYELCEQNRFG